MRPLRAELIGDGEPPKIRIIRTRKPACSRSPYRIGMDRQELIDNLGTIARSGTKRLWPSSRRPRTAPADRTVRRRFYSAFMVADRIVVTSRRAGSSEAWTCRPPAAPASRSPGREDDAKRSRAHRDRAASEIESAKYLEEYQIERIVGAYSDNIQFPIDWCPKRANAPDQFGRARWQRRNPIEARGYTQATSRSGAFDEPAMTLHYRAEGPIPMRCCCSPPSTKPFDLFEPARKGKVKLYVRRCSSPTTPT